MLTPLRLELVLTRMRVTLVSGKAVCSALMRACFTLPTSSRKLDPVMLRMVKPVATLAVNSGVAGADARSPSATAMATAAVQKMAAHAAASRHARRLGLLLDLSSRCGIAAPPAPGIRSTTSCGLAIGASCCGCVPGIGRGEIREWRVVGGRGRRVVRAAARGVRARALGAVEGGGGDGGGEARAAVAVCVLT